MIDAPVFDVADFEKLKPVVKKVKLYQVIALDPVFSKFARDSCKAYFKESYIEFHVSIDGAGNIFRLPYDRIKKGKGVLLHG